ncbi:hypothetical protein XELAEV_18031265mg, partial [Xenopus laevis]
GYPRVIIQQTLLSLTKIGTGISTARIKCQVKRESTDSSIVHWYMQKENEAIKRLLYIADLKPTYDPGIEENKFDSDKNSDIYTLIIQQIRVEDAATYYCANWDWDTQ